MIINEEKLKRGVSGIMRVKNDADFIKASVESCIDALDELIIVYNDCSDNSPQVIEEMRLKYPERIKVYEYKHKVYSINLTKAEYEYAKSLPNNSPHLLCNYYNFALSKVTYQHAMKIDADQIYFTEKLKKTCDIYRYDYSIDIKTKILGIIIYILYRIINIICCRFNFYMPVYNDKFKNLYKCYTKYVLYKASKGNALLSLSGLNIIKQNDEIYVPLGKTDNDINILPPYNGVGDHLIFKVSNKTFYAPYDCKIYNKLRSDKYTYIEKFVHPQKPLLPIGLFWYHVNTMRSGVIEKIAQKIKIYPNSFFLLNEFVNAQYKYIRMNIERELAPNQTQMLFQFNHCFNKEDLINNKRLLDNLL